LNIVSNETMAQNLNVFQILF